MNKQFAKRFSVAAIAILLFMVGLTFVSADEDASASAAPLNEGETTEAWFSPTDTSNTYIFNSWPEQSMFLVMVSDPNAEAPNFVIENLTKHETVASLRMLITGMCLRIAPGSDQYLVTVSQSAANMSQLYDMMVIPASSDQLDCPADVISTLTTKIALASANLPQNTVADASSILSGASVIDNPPEVIPPVLPPVVPPVVTPVPPVIVIDVDVNLDDCLAIAANLNANVRNATSTTSGIVAQIHAYTSVPVIGSVEGNAWLLVNHNGVLGFVSSAAVSVGGDCTSVPVVVADGSTALHLGLIVDLSLYLHVVTDLTGIVADLDLNVGDTTGVNLAVDANLGGTDGLNLGVDAGIGGADGINLDVDAGIGQDGLNVGVDAGLGDGGLNVGVGVGEGGIDVNVGGSNTGNTGSGNGGINVSVGGENGVNINIGGNNTGSNNGGGLNVGGIHVGGLGG